MENKLSKEYKDDLYEKVLEKKRIRTIKRKKVISFCIIFIVFIGMATFGFSKIEKENYNNYFVSKTENKYIDDEYEYFDDLGIKLEFINVDKDSITLGVNIKYEDIADYYVGFDKIIIKESKNGDMIYSNELSEKNEILVTDYNYKYINNDEMIIMIKAIINEDIQINNVNLNFENCIFENIKEKNIERINMNWKKEISIEG